MKTTASCGKCGSSFERTEGGSGRPAKYCTPCRKPRGTVSDPDAARERRNDRRKQGKEVAAIAATAATQDELVRLAAALSVLDDNQAAAEWVGVDVAGRDLDELVAAARLHHPDVADRNNLIGLTARMRAALAIMIQNLATKSAGMSPNYLGHSIKSLASAINALKPEETPTFADVSLTLTGADPAEMAAWEARRAAEKAAK